MVVLAHGELLPLGLELQNRTEGSAWPAFGHVLDQSQEQGLEDEKLQLAHTGSWLSPGAARQSAWGPEGSVPPALLEGRQPC